jgi:hypothetical protein
MRLALLHCEEIGNFPKAGQITEEPGVVVYELVPERHRIHCCPEQRRPRENEKECGSRALRTFIAVRRPHLNRESQPRFRPRTRRRLISAASLLFG